MDTMATTASTNDDEPRLVPDEAQIRTKVEEINSNKNLWLQRAGEFEKESQHLRAQARLLVEQAEEKEQEQRRCYSEVVKANDSLERLNYESVLLRLKRNDPTVVSVDTGRLPQGHGKALGLALQHNTVVQTLNLELRRFLPDSGHEGLQPLLPFLSANTSLVNLDVNFQEVPLVTLGGTIQDLSSSILERVAQSQAIERLTWDGPVAPGALARLLTDSKMLRKLDIAFGGVDPESDADRATIATAFENTQCNLQSLTLAISHEAQLLARILSNLHRIPTLKELFLKGNEYLDDRLTLNVVFDALSLLPTNNLRRFEMHGFEVQDSMLERLLSGLRLLGGPSSCPSTSLSELAFMECEFYDDAVDRLATLLQTTITNSDGEVVFQSSLRELCVDTRYETRLSDTLAVSLLMATDTADSSKKLPTIGSQIETLWVCDIQPTVLHHLADNADRVCLQDLGILEVTQEAGEALSVCLPKLTTIQKFSANSIMDSSTPHSILQGLKRNSSVVAFSTNSGPDSSLGNGFLGRFDEDHMHMIQAYCHRNKVLGDLLESGRYANPSLVDESTNTVFDQSAPIEVEELHYPSLLRLTEQTPRSCPAMLIRGLLTLDESVGLDD